MWNTYLLKESQRGVNIHLRGKRKKRGREKEKKYSEPILVVTLLQCLSHNLSPTNTRESEEKRLLIDSLSGPSVDFIPDCSVIYRDR